MPLAAGGMKIVRIQGVGGAPMPLRRESDILPVS